MIKNKIYNVINILSSFIKRSTEIMNKMLTLSIWSYYQVLRYYTLFLLGLFLFFLYIYVYFIRPRVPKDIPLDLTEIRFYIICYVCCIYLYVIYRFYYPKEINLYLREIIKKVMIPFVVFDNSLKTNRFTKNYYDMFTDKLIHELNKLSSLEYAGLYYIFYLFPRIILVICFVIEVFYANQIKIFYYFIFLNLIPITYNYLLYCLTKKRHSYYQELYSLYDIIRMEDENSTYISFFDRNPKAIYHNRDVSIEEYFKIQLQSKFPDVINQDINTVNKSEEDLYYYDFEIEDDTYEDPRKREIIYVGHALSKEQRYIDYRIAKYGNGDTKLTFEDYTFLNEPFRDIEPKLLDLELFFHLYKEIPLGYKIPIFRILIYMLYLIAWSYILYVSIPTLVSMPITLTVLSIFAKYVLFYKEFLEILSLGMIAHYLAKIPELPEEQKETPQDTKSKKKILKNIWKNIRKQIYKI